MCHRHGVERIEAYTRASLQIYKQTKKLSPSPKALYGLWALTAAVDGQVENKCSLQSLGKGPV